MNDDRTCADTRATPRRARPSSLWRALVERVLIDQVRSGRLRTEDWSPGLRAAGVVALLTGLLAVGLVLASGPIRAGTELYSIQGVSIPVPVMAPIFVFITLALSLLIAGLLHAPWPLRPVAILTGLSAFAAVGLTVPDLRLDHAGKPLVAAAFLLVAFVLWRWFRPSRWWEPVFLCGVMALGILVPLWLGPGDLMVEAVALNLLVFLLGALAAAPTIAAGFAIVEVAFNTSLWVEDLAGDRMDVRGLRIVTLVGAVLVTGVLAWRWTTRFASLPELFGAIGILAGAILLVRVADLVTIRRGRQVTDVQGLADRHGPVLWTVALIVGGVLFAQVVLEPLWAVARLWFFVERPEWAYAASSGTILSWILASAACLAIGVVAALRARGALSALALVLGLLLGLTAVRVAGVLRMAWSTAGLATLMAAVAAVAALVWIVRGRLSRERGEAIVGLTLLSLAMALPEVMGDPVGALLGAAGSGLVLFGVAWNLLTGSEFANGDSRRFPRSARSLVTLGLALVVLAHVLFATVIRGGSTGNTLDSLSNLGVGVLGPALLLVACIVLLFSAVADRPWRAPTARPRRARVHHPSEENR